MARGRRPTAPAPPAGSPRETARLSCPGCPGRWGAAKPRHIIAATNACVRRRATGSIRGAVAAGPTAWADRESCHAHVGMGAWVGQHRGGDHACLTPAGVEHLDRH